MAARDLSPGVDGNRGVTVNISDSCVGGQPIKSISAEESSGNFAADIQTRLGI